MKVADAARRDTDPDRVKAFRSTLLQKEAEVIEPTYGKDLIYLLHLISRPFFARQGGATSLLKWGQDFAREKKVPLSLFGSLMGVGLYKKLGFQDLGDALLERDDGEASMPYRAMVWTP